MPRSGGDSSKLGNRYEGLWTVRNLIDVLSGDAVALLPESYEEALGVEFVKTLPDGLEEFHSVKRQRDGAGWTLNALAKLDDRGRSVLKDLFDKLRADNSRKIVFISTTVHSQAYDVWDRAQRCKTTEEFERQLKTDKGLHEDVTDYLLPLCSNDLAVALERLHKLWIEPQGEYGLRKQVEVSIRRLVYRIDDAPVDAEGIVLKLADFIYDSLGRRLTESDVRSELARHGYHLLDWAKNTHVLGQVETLNRRYLRHVEADLILTLGHAIPRTEAATIAKELREKNGKLAQLVVGSAGRGKSCVLAQVVRELEIAQVPLIAIRLDNLPSLNSTRALGQEFELPDSPAVVLAGLSRGRRAVLLVDQLDAMSVVSGRNADLWQTFEELLQEVAQHPNLRLLLACRAFDLEHDPRLSRLIKENGPAQRIDVGLLPIETVKEVVQRGGGSPKRLRANELEILRTPFHLHLFLQGEPANPVSFGGRQELFARFWKAKRQKANERNVGFERVVGLLTDELSKSESISAPESRLDSVASEAGALVSDNVLVLENGRYRFFHESFFDYAFARRFVNTGRDLVHFLTEECGEQHLFRRAQVRQVLAYQREDGRDVYLVTLSALINHPNIRIHLKKLALDWLAQLDDPCEGEWHIIEQLLKHPQLHWAAFNVLWGKLPWFDLLDKLDVLPRLLSGNDEGFVDRCVRALGQDETLKHRSDRVASLLRPYQQKGESWMRRFKAMFQFGHFHHSHEMFEFVLGLVKEGLFDNGDELRWHSLTEMAEQRADFAVELLGTFLERMIAQAQARGKTNPFNQDGRNRQIEPRFIATVSQKAPDQFAERIAPIIKDLVIANAQPAKCGGFYDDVWHYIRYGAEHDADESLLGSVGRALQALARNDPQKCERLLKGWQSLEHKTLRFLLTCAWLGNPVYFAKSAADWFIAYQLAFIVDYDGGIGERDQAGGALPLLKAISPIIEADIHARLEAAIFGYVTPYEKSERKYQGYYELTLWRQLQPARIGKKGKARIAELEAKFRERQMTRSERRRQAQWKEGGFLPPPIPEIAFKKMTDSQLIKALQKYSSNERKLRDGRLSGNAHDIYSPLMHTAKSDRKRFANLVLKLPDEIAPSHFDAILWGLVDDSREVVKGGADGKTDVEVPNDPLLPTEVLLRIVQRVHRLPGKPCGRAICRVADAVATNSVPVELIEIVADYASNDIDPETEVWDEDAGSGGKYYGGDPLSAGINSARGSAADSFSRFLFAHKEMADRLMPYVEALAKDKSIAVRAVNIQALMALLNTHRDKSVELFLETSRAGEHLWASRPTEDFLYYATFSHYPKLRLLLQQMLVSKKKEARHAAARQITLAAFRHAEAEEDMKLVLSGDEECRRGAAEIYSHNVHNESVGEQCASKLVALFDDPAKTVRDTASRWFYRRNGTWTDWQQSLLAEYVESEAFADGDIECQMNLKDTPEKLPHEVLRLAEKSVELFEQELKKSSPDPFRFSHYMPSLALRFYEQSKDEAIRRKCLDLLDRMIEFGWGEASQELAKADRW